MRCARACFPGIEPDKTLIRTYFEAMVSKEYAEVARLAMGCGRNSAWYSPRFKGGGRTRGRRVTVVERDLARRSCPPSSRAPRSPRWREALREAGHQDSPPPPKGDEGGGRAGDRLPPPNETDKGSQAITARTKLISAVGVVGKRRGPPPPRARGARRESWSAGPWAGRHRERARAHQTCRPGDLLRHRGRGRRGPPYLLPSTKHDATQARHSAWRREGPPASHYPLARRTNGQVSRCT